MSAVIKSNAGKSSLGVRGLTLDRPPPPVSVEQQRIAALEARLEEATAETARLNGEVRRLEDAVVAARAEGREEGLIEGRAQAEDRTNEQIQAVTEAAREALALLAREIETFQQSAGDLAGLALGRIVGDASGRQSLIIDTIQRSTAGLFADVTVAVEVSASDFPNAAPLRAVIPAGCVVHLQEHLPSGACRLKLRMGEADLDLAGQVRRLKAVLEGGSTPA